ncbi:MAG: hypothetical protein ACI8VR_002197, partial [Candidatus Azotimanducaceae bacterium]
MQTQYLLGFFSNLKSSYLPTSAVRHRYLYAYYIGSENRSSEGYSENIYNSFSTFLSRIEGRRKTFKYSLNSGVNMYSKPMLVFLLGCTVTIPTFAEVPNTFVEGEPAVADDVNANFTALDAAIEINKEAIVNITLTAGTPGENGAPGINGAQGQTGEQGVQGEQGLAGVQGTQGEQGVPGQAGERGLQGEAGAPGLAGERGLQGEQGVQGEPGLTPIELDAFVSSINSVDQEVTDLQSQVQSIVANDLPLQLTNQVLIDLDLNGVNASGSDFTGSTIGSSLTLPVGIPVEDLTYLDIDISDFTSSVLANSNFVGANITDTLFLASNLRNANFTGATLTSTLTNVTTDYATSTSFGSADLAFSQFDGAIMDSASFTGAYGLLASFDGATMTNTFASTANFFAASFDGVQFNNAGFNFTELGGAVFDNTRGSVRMHGVNMQFGSFVNADLDKIGAIRSNFSFVDFTGSDFSTLDGEPNNFMPHSTFLNATAVGTNFTRSFLSAAEFDGANITDAIFDLTYMPDANFIGTQLPNASFAEATLASALFVHANLTNADFSQANLSGAEFIQSEVDSTDFSNADLTDATFTGIDLSVAIFNGTTCPDGSNSDNADNAGTCANALITG